MFIILIMSSASDVAHHGPDGRMFYGSVTVGERGQIVIPAQARRDHGIEAGQKLIVLGSPDGLALMSIDKLLAALGDAADLRARLETLAGGSVP